MRRLFLQLAAYDTVADRFDIVQMVNAASEGCAGYVCNKRRQVYKNAVMQDRGSMDK